MPKTLEYTSDSNTASSEDEDINLPGRSQVTQVKWQWKKVVTKEIPAFLEEAGINESKEVLTRKQVLQNVGVCRCYTADVERPWKTIFSCHPHVRAAFTLKTCMGGLMLSDLFPQQPSITRGVTKIYTERGFQDIAKVAFYLRPHKK
ncbi:hypothetical protein NPIL_517181 [Nephila pilipes]|uniref:Uncharacterized protein n=1 Tax=Nephila pilipes TaxID=299642 RepID=A0A8X6UCU2_NEPPI|nr:hypothetical protein NPIL_517181 [Nephila pilipes]